MKRAHLPRWGQKGQGASQAAPRTTLLTRRDQAAQELSCLRTTRQAPHQPPLGPEHRGALPKYLPQPLFLPLLPVLGVGPLQAKRRSRDSSRSGLVVVGRPARQALPRPVQPALLASPVQQQQRLAGQRTLRARRALPQRLPRLPPARVLTATEAQLLCEWCDAMQRNRTMNTVYFSLAVADCAGRGSYGRTGRTGPAKDGCCPRAKNGNYAYVQWKS